MKSIANSINYELIENTKISYLPLKSQVEFFINTLCANNIKLNKKIKNTDNFYYSTKAMEMFFTFPPEFVELFYKKYPVKEEFNMENTQFPSFLLGVLAGIERPLYVERDFILEIIEKSVKLGMNISEKTPEKANDLMKSFESFYIHNLEFYHLKKGFSCNKNIVDLALDTYQYELAMQLIEKYKIQPSTEIKVKKEDMLNYVIKILTCDQDHTAAESFDYKRSVENVMSFFKLENKYTMYDLLMTDNETSLIDFLTVLVKEEKNFKEFNDNGFLNMKNPSDIISEKFKKILKNEKDNIFTNDEINLIKSLLVKVQKKYYFIFEICPELNSRIERIFISNDLKIEDELRKIKRL